MHSRVYPQVTPYLDARRWVIGLSGGVDSVVLLHLLSQLHAVYPSVSFPPLFAVHINHQLQSNADDWQSFCEQYAASLNVPFEAVRVDVGTGASIEAQARDARYRAFATVVESDDTLLLAHHANDQQETLLFRLFRGAGVHGLAAMRDVSSLQGLSVIRPLLRVSRSVVEAYAKAHALRWCEDPSNQNNQFDRNFIRNDIVPLIATRWPAAGDAIARTAQHMSEASELLDELASGDMALLESGYDGQDRWLSIPATSISDVRLKNLFRYFFVDSGVSLSDSQWQVFLREVIGAAPDASPELLVGDYVIRRYRRRIYVGVNVEYDWQELHWDTSTSIDVPGYGCLSLSSQLSADEPLILTLRCRIDGVKVREARAGARSRKLKQILQERGIAPWRRRHVPLVYADDLLIAIADLMRLEGYESVLGESSIRCEDTE